MKKTSLNAPKIVWLTAIFLAILSAALRFQALRQTSFANGWDSYFYLLQIKSWLETGSMHSPEASMIYPFFAVFYWFSGDYVFGFKSGAAVLAGIFTLAVFLFFEKNNLRWAMFAAAWTIFSPQLTWFAGQYPKNMMGLILLLFFIRSLPDEPDFLEKKSKPKTWLTSLILLVFNYFGHRMTFGLAIFYLIFWLIFSFRRKLHPAIFSKRTMLASAIGLLIFFLAVRFFPGLFHFSDFERLGAPLRDLHFSPYLFVKNFGAGGRISGWWIFEIAVAVLAFFVAVFHLVSGERGGFSSKKLALLAICGLLLWPFGEWNLTSFSFRCVLVFVLLAPFLPDFSILKKWQNLNFPFFQITIFGLLLASFFSWKSYSPKTHDPNYMLFEKITRTAATHFPIEKPELVIAHNSLAEFFTFTTGTDAMPWLPEYPIDSQRLWRIATQLKWPEIEYFLGIENAKSVVRLPGGYFFLPENLWQKMLAAAKLESDEDFLVRATSWKNPSRMRPEFLLRRKKGEETPR